MKDILESYRQGIGGRVALHDNGLIWASSEEVPLTWMNSTIDGRPVTPRNGYQVEVNALWYNAVCYALELAGKYGDKTDKAFVKAWASLPARTQESFIELFRLPEGYLADFVDGSGPDKSTRPNMIVACGLNYKMLDEDDATGGDPHGAPAPAHPQGAADAVAPQPALQGFAGGRIARRTRLRRQERLGMALAAALLHQGLLRHRQATHSCRRPEEALENFDEDIQRYGIGSICELYDADPPYASRGAISQAWSVGAALDIHRMIRERSKGDSQGPKAAKKSGRTNGPKREKAGEDEACGEKRREDGKGRRQKSDRGEGPQGRGEKGGAESSGRKSRKEIKATK